MSATPKRRLIDHLGSSPTFVSEGSRVTGDVEASGPLVVFGTVRGDGRVGGLLHLAARAEWEGEVHAEAAVIAGRLSGRLVVEGKLEIGSTAVIRADVRAYSIAIARGAVIEGELTVAGGEPIIRFEEKRDTPEVTASPRPPPSAPAVQPAPRPDPSPPAAQAAVRARLKATSRRG